MFSWIVSKCVGLYLIMMKCLGSLKSLYFPLGSAETHAFHLTDMRYPWAQMEGHFDPLQIFT